ncbi:MAG: pirin family protein [Candidatus Hydrogenedentes bacterium]|nr:pirin family protein [Candidatus Hydrogenedentota bacterium]
MITIRRSNERGHFNHGWLDTNHTFSFGGYHDPEHMGFRALRVMNEDRVKPGEGFGEHGHKDMEILSYVLEGGLEHRDSLGNGSVLRPGMFQRMTAGSGIRHSEFNASDTEPVHFYQIWLFPERDGLEPGYEERAYSDEDKHNRLLLVAAREAKNGALTIHQDASVYLAALDAGASVSHALAEGRHAWIQVLRGSVTVNGEVLNVSDGAAISEETDLEIRATEDSEVLLFDLA